MQKETDVLAVVSAELPAGPGHPTTYSAKMLQAAENYLKNHEETGDPVPTIEGLADELGKTFKTLYNWRDHFPEFRELLERLSHKQGRLLQSKGLKKETDSGITKLLLSANHNKSEKTEQKTEHSGEIKFSSADRAIAEIDSAMKK